MNLICDGFGRRGRPRISFRAGCAALLAAQVLSCLFLLGSGCAHRPDIPTTSLPVRLELLLTSMAVDMDGRPGADGFGARIYATTKQSALGAVLVDGRLELAMFDGVIRPSELTGAVPLKIWTYPASDLKPYSQITSIGNGYRFALAWGDQKPTKERITVVARYVPKDGTAIVSLPGTITLTVR